MVPTDEELITEFLQGSQAAMEVLVKRHYKAVFAFLYRKTGDYHFSYDLAQEVFIRVLKALPSYHANGRFKQWLMKITINISKDYFRSRAFIEKSSTVEYMDVDSHISPFFENSVAYCDIRNAVLALPEDQSDAILLFYYNGYTIREISKMTNAREATVKSRIHQAVSKLKKALLGGEYNERI